MITADVMRYLVKVIDWLDEAPVGHVSYGEFHLDSTFVVNFDGERIGEIRNSDGQWVFVEDKR